MLVVLNDNCMSIDPNVGALKEYLTDITTSHTWNKVKDEVWNLLGKIGKFGPNAQAGGPEGGERRQERPAEAEQPVREPQLPLLRPGGWPRRGPLGEGDAGPQGHPQAPRSLACRHREGQGYKPAEEGSPTVWHAPGLFNKETGEIIKVAPRAPTAEEVPGRVRPHHRGTGREEPQGGGRDPRHAHGLLAEHHDEGHARARLRCGHRRAACGHLQRRHGHQGWCPSATSTASFMQRAYDQVVHDVALQNLNVVFCLDRGGLAGADGPTHHGAFDVAYFRCIPNMVVSAPMNEEELRNLMYTAQLSGPRALQHPLPARAGGVMTEWKTPP